MISRKLQKTAKGSFLVTLPRPLVLALELNEEKKMEVKLENRSIILTPASEGRQTITEAGETHTTRGV